MISRWKVHRHVTLAIYREHLLPLFPELHPQIRELRLGCAEHKSQSNSNLGDSRVQRGELRSLRPQRRKIWIRRASAERCVIFTLSRG